MSTCCCMFSVPPQRIRDVCMWFSRPRRRPLPQYTLIVIIVAFVGLCCSGAMAGYHVFISCMNETTFEQIMDLYMRQPTPHKRGCRPFWQRLCGRKPRSLVEPQRWVVDDDPVPDEVYNV